MTSEKDWEAFRTPPSSLHHVGREIIVRISFGHHIDGASEDFGIGCLQAFSSSPAVCSDPQVFFELRLIRVRVEGREQFVNGGLSDEQDDHCKRQENNEMAIDKMM